MNNFILVALIDIITCKITPIPGINIFTRDLKHQCIGDGVSNLKIKTAMERVHNSVSVAHSVIAIMLQI